MQKVQPKRHRHKKSLREKGGEGIKCTKGKLQRQIPVRVSIDRSIILYCLFHKIVIILLTFSSPPSQLSVHSLSVLLLLLLISSSVLLFEGGKEEGATNVSCCSEFEWCSFHIFSHSWSNLQLAPADGTSSRSNYPCKVRKPIGRDGVDRGVRRKKRWEDCRSAEGSASVGGSASRVPNGVTWWTGGRLRRGLGGLILTWRMVGLRRVHWGGHNRNGMDMSDGPEAWVDVGDGTIFIILVLQVSAHSCFTSFSKSYYQRWEYFETL